MSDENNLTTAVLPPFEDFPKIPRYNREIIVSEKIDGTNAGIYISDDFSLVHAASRTKWITPSDDNKGFAKWVKAHEEELRTGLGPGMHFGEWWGSGIARGYGLKEKRFSLFNSVRWTDDVRPKCCGVVPILAKGTWEEAIPAALKILREGGSVAAPGFMKPEGIVVFHPASGNLYKITLENDASPKGLVQE